uniref:Uncharacterized protein n=1 Tax=Cucumis melo TaxID=3656 RepID=A0A9I9E7R5_CUCME
RRPPTLIFFFEITRLPPPLPLFSPLRSPRDNLPPSVKAAIVTLVLRSSLAQVATFRAAPFFVSHLLCVATSESEASGLCLLQSVFVHKAPAVVTSPRTQPPSRSLIRTKLVSPSILFR